jgi:aminoethylphosphonate catabolism LysR family transcriptional regulator
MRYVQLRAFHHVATCGSFSRAASALSLTQPAISDQVRGLEREYDALLFDRERRRVALTPMGERLLAVTRKLFEAEGQARHLLDESRALHAGTLRLVADCVQHVLPALIAFRGRYPGVGVTIKSGNTDSVLAALARYEADIGVLGDMEPQDGFEAVRLNETPILAFVAAGHPWAGRRSASLADLAELPLVMREQRSRTRQLLERRAAETGIALHPAIQVEGREAVRDLVAAGLGVGFVSAAEFGDGHGLAPLAIEGPPIRMEETLICLHERRDTATIRAFLEIAATVPPLALLATPPMRGRPGADGPR